MSDLMCGEMLQQCVHERMAALLREESIAMDRLCPCGGDVPPTDRHYVRLTNRAQDREVVLVLMHVSEVPQSTVSLLAELLEEVYYGATTLCFDEFLDRMGLSPDIESNYEYYERCVVRSEQLRFLLGAQVFKEKYLAVFEEFYLVEV